jgi:drug/metabolite transporter (DMT)-like permease
VATPPGQKTGSSTFQNLPDTNTDTGNDLQAALPRKTDRRNIVITTVAVLIVAGAAGVLLFFRQPVGQGDLFGKPQLLLGLCIVLSIAFTVGFNIISRVSLSTTKHESAYTILWQLFCALLVPFFLPFDRFSIDASPRVLLLFALSVILWALVDAFLFSSFKYEEASILSAIFPLNYVFTFAVSVVFLHSAIHSTIVIGFLIIMTASLLIGLRYLRVRPSKGIIFALLYSLFQGVALGFNSEVVKSFSIPPYMLAAFLFPAIANLFIFLRPKVSELRYELRVQWKKILLNAAVMDISFFFLLKAFELGNVPQVVALSASSTLLTALAGIVILKEDSHVALKILAAALATLGIILVQL